MDERKKVYRREIKESMVLDFLNRLNEMGVDFEDMVLGKNTFPHLHVLFFSFFYFFFHLFNCVNN